MRLPKRLRVMPRLLLKRLLMLVRRQPSQRKNLRSQSLMLQLRRSPRSQMLNQLSLFKIRRTLSQLVKRKLRPRRLRKPRKLKKKKLRQKSWQEVKLLKRK